MSVDGSVGFRHDGVVKCCNFNFTGNDALTTGQVTADGQLMIGATAFPNIRVGSLTSTGGSITITPGAGTINLDLAGGSVGVDSIATQAATGPGTNPTLPTAGGLVTINGSIVASHAIPLQTNALAANTFNVEAQYSNAAVGSVATNAGMASFNSAQFTVDAVGWVSFSGASTSPWLDSAGAITLATFTGYFATAVAAYTLPAAPAQGTIIEIVDTVGGGVALTASGGDKIRFGNQISSANGAMTSTATGDSARVVYRTVGATWFAAPGTDGNWTPS